MDVTATELKNNLGHYLKVIQTEDVRIMRNGRHVAKLVSLKAERVEKAQRLFGVGKVDADIHETRTERRSRYASAD
jgi:prevent-host-death family protein